MKEFIDDFELVRKCLYITKIDISNKFFAQLIQKKVELLYKALFRSLDNGMQNHHSLVFLTMREMIFTHFLVEQNGKSFEINMDKIASAYDIVNSVAFRTFLALLEPTTFLKISNYFPHLLEDYASITQFVDTPKSQKFENLVKKHEQNVFIIIYKVMCLASSTRLPGTTIQSLREFLNQRRYPDVHIDLPFFDFDASFSGGEVHTIENDFYTYLTLSAFILQDYEINSILPKESSLYKRKFQLERMREEIAKLDSGFANSLTNQTFNFNSWKKQLLESIQKELDEIPRKINEEIKKAPISQKNVNEINRAIKFELSKWPTITNFTEFISEFNVSAKIDIPKEILIESGENVIDLATKQIGRIVSQTLLNSIVELIKPKFAITLIELLEKPGNYILFVPRSQYILYRRYFEDSFSSNVINHFDDLFTNNTHQIYIKLVNYLQNAILWKTEEGFLPFNIKEETLISNQIKSFDTSITYEYHLPIKVVKNIDSYSISNIISNGG